jgi:hypothetical protein
MEVRARDVVARRDRRHIDRVIDGARDGQVRASSGFDSAAGLRHVHRVPTLSDAPEVVRALLWDVDVEAVDIARDRALLCERVMSRGGLAAMHWLLRAYDDDALRAFVDSPAGARLAPREQAFWRLAVGLPATSVRGGGRPVWAG